MNVFLNAFKTEEDPVNLKLLRDAISQNASERYTNEFCQIAEQ